MKKISILCFAALAMVACNKNGYAPQTSQAELFAVNDEASVKTHLENMSVLWDNGDAINVFAQGQSYKFATSESGASVKFKGEGITIDNSVYTLFPYIDGATFSAGTFNLPIASDEQKVVNGTFTASRNIAVGQCDNDKKVSFKSIGALLKFKLGQAGADTLKRIEIKSNGGEPLAITGAASVSFNGGDPVITPAAGATCSDKIVLTPSNGKFASGDTYYVWVLPGKYDKGITLTLVTPTQMKGVKAGTSALTISRNQIVDLGEIKDIVYKEDKKLKILEFDFSSTTPLEGWTTNAKKAWTTESKDSVCTYPLKGTDYKFRLCYPPIAATTTGQITWDNSGKGLVLWTKFRYVGLPYFKNMRLIKVDIVQGTSPNTSRQGAITTDIPVSNPTYVKGGEVKVWSTADISYELEDTKPDTEYFLACINSGIGAKTLTLTYEEVKE